MKWNKATLLLPLAVLLTALYVTYELWGEARHATDQALRTNFDFRVRESVTRIEHRLLTYEEVLRGARALFAPSNEVLREEFRDYVAILRLDEDYPGIQGIGYAVALSASEKDAHVAATRLSGFPDYDISPGGERDFYSSIIYLEPFSGRNLRAFGYDMYSDPTRRAAMERARDTGEAAISGKVTLIQETDRDLQPGFLMYLPVYRNNLAHESVAQRRNALAGWVYAPFRMHDLMRNLNSEADGDLSIRIFDGKELVDAAKMYDSAQDAGRETPAGDLVTVAPIEIGGRYWTVVASATPSFERRFDYGRPMLVARGGISISLLLALLAWVFLDDRTRAIRAAHQAMHLALYDVLTGLPNRKLITERLSQAVVTAKRENIQAALMFIDLDKFKPVNDDYGHAIGDLLLKEVARRLQHCMRATDTVARLGGDEFVALLPHVEGRQGAMVVAKKILHALSEPFEVAGHSFHISGSIGVAFYPDDGRDEKQLIRNADTAMYHAKKSGRNGVSFYSPHMRAGSH